MSDFMKEIQIVGYEVSHPFADVKNQYLNCGKEYRCLILGTFPSVASRDSGYFYGNSSNEFWEILGNVIGKDLQGMSNETRKKCLDDEGIALYDVVESYEGFGWYSSDILLFGGGKNHKYSLDFVSSFLRLFEEAKVMVTSRDAERKFLTHFINQSKNNKTKIEKPFYLPSPSSSNRMSKDEKKKKWQEAFEKAGLIK